jgi:uncharacterized protein
MRRSVAVFGAALFIVITILPAFAQSLERGWDAYLASRYSEAWRELRPLAERGNADAQYYVGTMVQHGHGTRAHARRAAEWYAQAGRQGHSLAQFALGFLLYYGGGDGDGEIYADPGAAAPWLLNAAQRNVVPAQHLVGRMYRDGIGLPANREKALEWTRRAADVGMVPAQFDAGLLLAEQPGLDKALEAYKWFELAARAHHPGAAQNRDRLINRLNSQELRQGQAMADAWKPGS